MFFEREKHPQDYITDQTFLLGLFTGLTAGLAAGLLLAPRSGKELRNQIADNVSEQTKEAKHQWDKTKAQARETIDTIKTNVGNVADKAQNGFNTYADKVESKTSDVADDLKTEVNQVKSRFNIG